MKITYLEKAIGDFYSLYNDVNTNSILKDLDTILNNNPTRDNVADLLDNVDFKMNFIELLPLILTKYTNDSYSTLLDNFNKFRKKIEVEKKLSETGGVFIDSNEIPFSIVSGYEASGIIPYNIDSVQYSPSPTTYQTYGNVSDIKDPSVSYTIFGRTLKDFKIILNISLTGSTKSIFLDTAGCSAKLVGTGVSQELNDGYTTVDIRAGRYRLELYPELTNGSFFIMIRALMFSKNIITPARYIYSYPIIDLIGDFTTIVLGGEDIKTSAFGYESKDVLSITTNSIGDVTSSRATINLANDIPISPTINEHFKIIGNISENENHLGTIISLSPITRSINIEIPNFFGASTYTTIKMYSSMFYVKEGEQKFIPKPSYESSNTKIFRFNKDAVQFEKTVDRSITLTDPGIYFIISSTATYYEYCLSYINSISKYGLIIPGQIINGVVKVDWNECVLNTIPFRNSNGLWFRSNSFSSSEGNITIESNKPINGIIITR